MTIFEKIKLGLICTLVLAVQTTFCQTVPIVLGEVWVKMKPSSKAQKVSLKTQIVASTLKSYPTTGIELWHIPNAEDNEAATLQLVEELNNHPEVEFAEPNFLWQAVQTGNDPNDPMLSELYGMQKIKAPEAWNIGTGSPSVIVGILDTGIDWTHEDLADNIWQNLQEDADGDGKVIEWNGNKWVFDPDDENGIDDDSNGYADDFIGWDFINDDNNPMDDNSHGTHCAGTVGAAGNNNLGVAGVCWNVQLAALKFLGSGGYGSTDDAVDALNYALEMDIKISNNSWGGSSYSIALYQAIQQANEQGHLFVAAAGNNNSNNDIHPHYPSAYDNTNIIAVASTDVNDNRSGFSNYGSNSVDLAAPGTQILSCVPGNAYGRLNGTSMATPHVAGACALLWSEHPNYNHFDIKSAVINSVDPIDNMNGKSVSGGRLNVLSGLTYFNSPTDCNRTTDSLALVALYQATGGPNWLIQWDFTKAMDTWFGISLDENGRVICIDLDGKHDCSWPLSNGNNLTGAIPPEIGNLCELTYLDLSDNNISGTIPPEMGMLNKLIHLELTRNDLTGNIPDEIGELSNLRSMEFGANELSGNIPATFGNLSNLQFLTLQYNFLNGQIPADLSNLSELKYLKLGFNQLTGNIPAELGYLTNIERIYLNDNQLSGTIPATFAQLENLERLFLNNNNLSGCFAPELKALCHIDFYFDYYPINGHTIDMGNNFNASWEDFCATDAGICSIPVCNRTTDSLALVALYQATGGPNWLIQWDFTQPMDTWFGISLDENGRVICIDLDGKHDCSWPLSNGNNLTGAIPPEIGNLCELTYLDLSDNNISGTIPPEMGMLNKLIHLELTRNDITGNIPDEIGNLSNLRSMQFGANELSGNIPSTFEKLSYLEDLVLSYNYLSGEIPTDLSNLSELKNLNLGYNQLTGSIPPELGYLTNIERIYLNDNQLIGEIPSELCNLTDLVNLKLMNNQITGVIPCCLSNLHNLQYFGVNDNDLSGCYCDDLTELFCNVLANNEYFYGNGSISNGNNFDATWEEFCFEGLGNCEALSGLVWPGDFNNNGTVEITDLLHWGLANGTTGTVRPNATTDWVGQDCTDWQNVIDNVNGKHIDGTGDGIVNDNDINVLVEHYEKTHNFNLSNAVSSSTNFEIVPVSQLPAVSGGVTYTYDIFLDDLGTAVSAHGIALIIDFGDLNVTEAFADISNSSLQASEFLEYFDKESKTLSVSLTRSDQTDIILNGSFLRITVAVVTMTDTFFQFALKDGVVVKADGSVISVAGTTIYEANTTGNGINSPNISLSISVSHANCEIGGTVQIINAISGTPPYYYQWNTGDTGSTISNLSPGIYEVLISDANGLEQNVTVEVQGQFISEFDAAGNQLPCNTYASCPTVIDFGNYLPSGIHQAGSAIHTNANLSQSSEVELKAGKRLTFTSGFSTRGSERLKVRIEDCE